VRAAFSVLSTAAAVLAHDDQVQVLTPKWFLRCAVERADAARRIPTRAH
jgi:hypothetical protein